MKTTVLYHKDNDGFGAAYAAWTKLGDEATYIAVQYNEPVPEIPEGTTNLCIVDFSYDRATVDALRLKYAVVILDHHKTAQAALADLPCAIFDMSKSGARLAWEYFWPTEITAHGTRITHSVPAILQYVEDYDLWKFQLPDSKEVNLYLSSLPWDFQVWHDLATDTARFTCEAPHAGRAIKAFRDNQIKSAMKNARRMWFEVNGERYVVPVVNASENISELGNELCKAYPDMPFSVSYCDRLGCRSWSLRSIGDFDVSAIAKVFGGGGHRNAAGFSTEHFWPQGQTEEFIKAFEEV